MIERKQEKERRERNSGVIFVAVAETERKSARMSVIGCVCVCECEQCISMFVRAIIGPSAIVNDHKVIAATSTNLISRECPVMHTLFNTYNISNCDLSAVNYILNRSIFTIDY